MRAVRNEQGSILVFATLMMVLLLIMVGMGLDMGQLTYVRNQGQAAVDAAALAAVSALPSGNPQQVNARAAGFNSTNNYVESPTNAIGSTSVSYIQYDYTTNDVTNYNATINTANGVRVALEDGNAITTPMFLTPLLNLLGIATASTKDTNVSAVATIQSKPSIPIVLWESMCPGYPAKPYDSSQTKTIDIKMQHPDQKEPNENACWTTFLDPSSGAPDIKAGFKVAAECTGKAIDGEISIGTKIYQNKGQVNSVLQESKDFFGPYMPNTWWIIPVIGGGGNCDPSNPSPITTWAKIRPTDIKTTGNPKYITAEIACGDDLRNSLNLSLCFSHRLVRQKVKNM